MNWRLIWITSGIILTLFALQLATCEKGGTKNNYSPVEEHSSANEIISRRKRFVPKIVGFIGLVSSLLGITDFIYGKVTDAQDGDELQQISNQLQEISEKIDGLSHTLDDVRAQQQWQEAVTVYADDVQRLMYLLHILTDELTLQQNGALTPADRASSWADGVLSDGPGGIAEVLYNFHSMMMGNSELFSRTPLFVVYFNTVGLSDCYCVIQDFYEYTFSVQVAGYAAWATALNVKGQHDKVSGVSELGHERLIEQQDLLEQHFADIYRQVIHARNNALDTSGGSGALATCYNVSPTVMVILVLFANLIK